MTDIMTRKTRFVDLSLAELKALNNAIPQEIERRVSAEKAEKAALVAELRTMARAKGFVLDDLFRRRRPRAG